MGTNGTVQNVEQSNFLFDSDGTLIFAAKQPVSSTSVSLRLRSQFSEEDDKLLLDWVTRAEIQGIPSTGFAIFRDLERVNPRHTYQSWHARWTKKLKVLPRPKVELRTMSQFRENFSSDRGVDNSPLCGAEFNNATREGAGVPFGPESNASNPHERSTSDGSHISLFQPLVHICSQDVDESPRPRARSEKALRAILGLESRSELATWLLQDWVLSAYAELAKSDLDERFSKNIGSDDQNKTGFESERNSRCRGSSMKYVVNCAMYAIRHRSVRYLGNPVDKRGWQSDDHAIRFICRLVHSGRKPGCWWDDRADQDVEELCVTCWNFMGWLRHIHSCTTSRTTTSQYQMAGNLMWINFLREGRAKLPMSPVLPVSSTSPSFTTTESRSCDDGSAEDVLIALEASPSLSRDSISNTQRPEHSAAGDSDLFAGFPPPGISTTVSIDDAVGLDYQYRQLLEFQTGIYPQPAPQDRITPPNGIVTVFGTPEALHQRTSEHKTTTARTSERVLDGRNNDSLEVCTTQATPRVPNAPHYTLQMTKKTEKNGNMSLWIVAEGKERFLAYQQTLLASWGVSTDHQSSCVLVPQMWEPADPMELCDNFGPETCPPRDAARLKYPMAGRSPAYVRAMTWFAEERRGIDLDNFFGAGPFMPMEGSHLCHQGFCINPHHAVYEAAVINGGRARCVPFAQGLRKMGLDIPKYCVYHDPPCLLQNTALSTYEAFCIQVSTLRKAKGLAVTQPIAFPADHEYKSLEWKLPLSFSRDSIQLDTTQLVNTQHSPDLDLKLRSPIFYCRFCMKYSFRTVAGYWTHLREKEKLIPSHKRLEEIKASAQVWQDHLKWARRQGHGVNRRDPTWLKLQQVVEENFSWEVVLTWKLGSNRNRPIPRESKEDQEQDGGP